MKEHQRRPEAQPLSFMPRGYAFALFPPAVIEGELTALRRALGANARAEQPDIDPQEWFDFIERLACRLGPLPEIDFAAQSARESGSDSDLQMLACRLRQAIAAVRHAQRQQPTCLLLPVTYADRFRMLIQTGQLPLAWMVCLDVLRVE